MQVKNICILGGGTAGFGISSMLARYRELSGLDFGIKVVHSEEIGRIGVGESTLININDFFGYLGLRDSDWMSKCNATYKTALKFTDFYKKETEFYYPFGRIDPKVDVSKWFVSKDLYPGLFTQDKASLYFIPSSILSLRNKLTDQLTGKGFDFDSSTAYHFDAHLVGNFLKEYSEKRGVEVIDDKFYGTEQDKYGNIESIVCDNGSYHADLFIDCSGFKSLLLGKAMMEKYVPFSDTLINNKVLRAKIPYSNKEEQLKNYTNSVALDNGWCWHIPLWNHISVGYVHTNQFATEEEIEQEFFEHVGEVEYETLTFRTGRYDRAWVKNVVALGLSYGFIEPLESNGISSTIKNFFSLTEQLFKRDLHVTQVDRDIFNNKVGNENIDPLRTFVELHYILSLRNDTDYWRYTTEVINWFGSNTSGFSYETFLKDVSIDRSYPTENHLYPTHLFTAAGNDYSFVPKDAIINPVARKDLIDQFNIQPLEFQGQLDELEDFVKSFPSTYKFLAENIYQHESKESIT